VCDLSSQLAKGTVAFNLSGVDAEEPGGALENNFTRSQSSVDDEGTDKKRKKIKLTMQQVLLQQVFLHYFNWT